MHTQAARLTLEVMCRASKSAQNQLSKCMAIEFARRKQNIAVVMLHPGTVDTDLSEPFQKVHTCFPPPAYVLHAGFMQSEVNLAAPGTAASLSQLLLGQGLSQPFHNAQTCLLRPHLQCDSAAPHKLRRPLAC